MVRKNKSIIHDSLFMIHSRGFTLVELVVVTSIIITLLGFITISLVRSQQGASLTSVEEILLTDLKQQQLKAMIGDTEGRATSDSYGIHFDTNRYVLFHGVYSAEETSNFVINLDSNIQFDNPGTNVAFKKISGEITDDSISNVVLKDTTNGNTKTITVNKYGVITGVN